jgi:DNA replication protein DnaC
VPKLFAELALARADGRHRRLLRSLTSPQVLILDDWGLEPLDAAARHDLLEILEDRYGRRSTIITSQVPVEHWHQLIGEAPLGRVDKVREGDSRDAVRCDSKLIFMQEIGGDPGTVK